MGTLTRVFIVRHGQTEWNRDERFRGTIDVPLNDVGLAQARAAAQQLAAERDVVAVYSSPRARAWRTAEPIAGAFDLPVQPLAGIDDLNFGEWQGLTPAEVEQRWPELYRRWLLAPHTIRFPGGENLEALRARSLAALEEVVTRHDGHCVVLATHKVVCKVLISAAIGLDNAHYWQIEMDNAGFSLLEHEDGRCVLRRLNDTCHLRGR